MMKFIIVAALLVSVQIFGRAQEISGENKTLSAKIADPELRQATEQVLQRKNYPYTRIAERNQMKNGEFFSVMRVEVTGVLSNDDTDKYDPELFQDQIKPSFSTEEYMTATEKAVRKFQRFLDPARTREAINDSVEYAAAARGEMTANSRRKLSAYKGVEVNEIIAHSWGTELIYAAILSGAILPPKKLIVIGVPDNNFEKWTLLAKMTGTEVHWVRADNDVVRDAQKDAELIGLDAGRKVDFKAKWAAVCEGRTPNPDICHAHDRSPERPFTVHKIGKLPGVGHDRLEYYRALKKKKLITKTYRELQAEMDSNLTSEVERVKTSTLKEALVEARGLVEQARRQRIIADREHDERLRDALIDIISRSCAKPGSISQDELDNLPRPNNPHFYCIWREGVCAGPQSLDSCGDVYVSLGPILGSGGRLSAEELQRRTTPLPPVPVARAETPKAQPVRAVAVERRYLWLYFPGLRDLAVNACRSGGEARIDPELILPSVPYSFQKGIEDDRAAQLSVGLGDCERVLFLRLIEMIRNRQGDGISQQWLRDRVSEYSPRYVPPPAYSDPCRDNGNIRCP